MDGGGRNVLPGYALAHGAYFGQSAEYAFVGGYTPGLLGFSTAPQLLTDPMFTTPILVWPLHFSEEQYNLAQYTYGYIQNQVFSAYASDGQVANLLTYMIRAVNVTVNILFKKEGIITPTPYNMSARVRLFNDQSQLVAEWMSSEGTYVYSNGWAIAANGVLQDSSCVAPDGVGSNCDPLYPFGNLITIPQSGLNGYNFVPAGTTFLDVQMAGLPQQPPLGAEALTGTYFGDPIATGLPVASALGPQALGFGGLGPYGSCSFQLNCYSAAYGQYPFPYTGIAGAADYVGGWTAEVDFVPWYRNNTGTPEPLDPCQVASSPDHSSACTSPQSSYAQYYPPVDGLLMGESYHIIPGTTATSGISLTEDMAQNNTFLGHSMAPNHFGPYSQEGAWQIAGAHNSGEASANFEVDLNGFISGGVMGFTWSNEFRTISWGTVSVTSMGGVSFGNFYTYDGVYQAFLPPGRYSFVITEPGYLQHNQSISVSPGENAQNTVYLEQSQTPVPEFNGVAVVTASTLAASLWILKRRRRYR
jgi:hypothetical protein